MMGALTQDPWHWVIALGITMTAGLPVIYLTTRLGVASGIRAFYGRLDSLRGEMHELRGEFETKNTRTWEYASTILGKVNRIEDRVARLEGDRPEEE